VRLLLENGVDVAARNSLGSTALHCAAFEGRNAVVRLLLEKGADAAARDRLGATALHCAKAKGRKAATRLLQSANHPTHHRMDNGFDIRARNFDQRRALQRISSPLMTIWHRNKTYSGASLDRTRHEIRLLKILPGNEDDPIRCTLSRAVLDEQPEYEALSYVWGDPKHRRKILVDGRKTKVTINLEVALRHLRNPNTPRTVWIDALYMYS
jgi:ankyrin repeat protein